MGIWEGAGSAAVGGVSGAIGMIGQNHRANQQQDRQKELMDIQNKNQQGLNQQGHDLQFDMWNKTNAKAQMEHYKEAGLNPGLMYGGSGAGGATTGSQGGGSAASGQAAAPMDIGNITQMMKAFGEIALNLSSENKNNSEGDKNKSITDMNIKELEVKAAEINLKLKQADTEEGKQNLMQEQAAVQKAIAALTGQQTKTEEERTNLVGSQAGIAATEDEVKWGTKEDQKAIIQQEAKLQGLKGEKTQGEIKNLAEDILVKTLKRAEMQAGISLTKEKKDAIWHQVWQGWTNAGFKGLGSIIDSINIFKPKRKKVTMHKDKDGQIEYNQTNTKEW